MRKITILILLAAVSLWAADFWIAKPFTDWNEKDLQKLLTDSPWAHKATVAIAGGRSARGGGSGTGFGTADGSESGGGRGGGGGGRGASGPQGGGGNIPDDVPQVIPSVVVVIRSRTALPIKQAFLKAQYGSEVGTSPEAKKIMDKEETLYAIEINGIPAAANERLKETLMKASSLSVKGKEPIMPSDIQFNPRGPTMADAFVLFPKTNPITLDDKEVEFATTISGTVVKFKFKLKDMVYKNKLEL
jgi:hypothetical protein